MQLIHSAKNSFSRPMKGNLDSEYFSFWNLESRNRLESQIQIPLKKNPESSTMNPESTARNPLFWILLLEEVSYRADFSVVTQPSTFAGWSVA